MPLAALQEYLVLLKTFSLRITLQDTWKTLHTQANEASSDHLILPNPLPVSMAHTVDVTAADAGHWCPWGPGPTVPPSTLIPCRVLAACMRAPHCLDQSLHVSHTS